jgi:long-chain acyl-CoA synthetase
MKKGDRVGILSGNCDRYIELFFGATLMGVIVVVLNNTYTPIECVSSLEHSGKSRKTSELRLSGLES